VRHTDCAYTAMQATTAKSNQQLASPRISFPTPHTQQFYCRDLHPAMQHNVIVTFHHCDQYKCERKQQNSVNTSRRNSKLSHCYKLQFT